MRDEHSALGSQLRGMPDPLGLLETLFAHAPVGFQLWNSQGFSVLTNAAFRELFGAAPSPDDNYLQDELAERQGISEAIRRAFVGETVQVGPLWYEARQLRHATSGEGKAIAIQGTLFPLRDAEGAVTHVAGAFKDVTTEMQLRASEERLNLLMTKAPVAFFSLDGQGYYTAVEGQRLRALGMQPSDLLGQSSLELTANDPTTHSALSRALAGEELMFRGQSRAGGTFECRLIPDLTDDGRVRAVSGITYDVTQQDRAEQALRKSEEHLRLALGAGRLVAIEVDFTTDRCTASANALEVLGARPDQLRSLKDAMAMIHPDDLYKAQSSLAYSMKHGVQVPDVQYRIIRPDNREVVWFERRINFVRDASGAVSGLRGLVIDITERKRSDEIKARSAELQLQNTRIEETNRLKSEFLANMSHELRTPLNAIIGFAELLHDGHVDPSSPRHAEFLGDILLGGRHLLRLINDVLDLAKVEAGKQEFWPEPVVLPQLINEVCNLLRSTAANKRIVIETQLDASLTDIVIDPARCKQVLFNYLSNALKFTNEGGRVWVRTLAEDELTFRIEVEDNGIGIAPADMGRLFRDFRQLEAGANKRHQGTGLGLVLTRRLVEAQGGSVGLQSRQGVGSTFSATLPRGPSTTAAVRPPPPPRTSHAPGDQVVLVVEDDLRDQQQLVTTLQHAGYRAELATRGVDALELCQKHRYDAVTLDLLLPDMSGLELLAAIRAGGKNLGVPVIVVTVVAEPSVLSNFQVHDVLLKPFEPSRLLESLQAAGLKAVQ